MTVLQWNCHGFQEIRHELELLIGRFHPSVICFEETFLPENISLLRYVNFDILASVRDSHPHGGVSLLVNVTFTQLHITLNTTPKIVGARVTLHCTITVCSVYLPPSLLI